MSGQIMKIFEWDENKRTINLEKHGIDFINAVGIFGDVNRIELETIRNGESRVISIGRVYDIILLVVYVHRQEKKRLISARRASAEERECYESNS